MARIRLGNDPQDDKICERASLTVSELCETFLDDHVKVKLKPRTAEWYRITLAPLKSAYGNTKAGASTRAKVAALHRDMAGTSVQANRMLSAVSALFGWGEKSGLMVEGSKNPAAKLDRFRVQARERFLTSEELARLGDALRLAETEDLPR